jgi:aryl-alcohol dehydrogenase-like predicted oxidoreductase
MTRMKSIPALAFEGTADRRLAPLRSIRLGLGCASLGSRIGPTAGARALSAAYDAGVTWFDVAPAYGLGAAELLLGEFLKGRRQNVSVTTKVGIAPPERLRLMKYAYAIGRPALSVASGLRCAFRKIKATRNRHLPLDANLVESSIARSLKRLQTDYVDVFALHDPSPEDVLREEVLRALQRVLERGQARRIAVAGGTAACRAASRAQGPYGLLQMSVAHFAADPDFAECGKQIVLHSVFGVDGMRDRLLSRLARSPERHQALVESGYSVDRERAVADLLLERALALNAEGIVLTSMFAAGHLTANLAVASRAASPRAIELLSEMMA